MTSNLRFVTAIATALVTLPAHAAGPARAEIQVALCDHADALERKLDLRKREAAYRTWLFDDASLSLLSRGLRLRLRVKADGSELALKAGGQDCNALSSELVPKGEGKCELDLHGDTLEGAVSLVRALDTAATRDLLADTTAVSRALSNAQVRFLRDVTKVWPLPADLRPLGPIANEVYRTRTGKFDLDVTTLPGGERYVEIAVKVPLPQLEGAKRRLDAYLAKHDVTVCADQNGQAPAKLRKLLELPVR